MAIKKISETETVIKNILPYLNRRGYDTNKDLAFEVPTNLDTEIRKGYIDILVKAGKKKPIFLIEAKRDGIKLTAKHRKQALDYGRSYKCLFVALTNGSTFELINVKNGKPLKLNGSSYNRIPKKSDLIKYVLPQLKSNPSTEDIIVPNDKSIPYRPSVSRSRLNQLIKQCHNLIRKIEKNEENAFADFSKILFLKLLEEKWDQEGVNPLYSYKFHELASTSKDESDRVRIAVNSMISTVRNSTKYGEVLYDSIKLKQDAAYLALVKKISSVSWSDCNLDTKGAVFEHFVRATLKGKKLGQYFTPRPLVEIMLNLGGYKQIVNSLLFKKEFFVVDPSCGTGGFLVFGLNYSIEYLERKLQDKEISKEMYDSVVVLLKEKTFFGIDANEGVASSAKMNMIIAGDGHNNIRCRDTLKLDSLIPTNLGNSNGKAHLVLANPPFGTSESDSLSSEDLQKFSIKSTKGQSLFIQQMIMNTRTSGKIVTVIDEGVLNTSSYTGLRDYILENCRILGIIQLPDDTFKPNKINVKSSLLVLEKRHNPDVDFDDDYNIPMLSIKSLGYDGSGSDIRNFDHAGMINTINTIESRLSKNKKTHEGIVSGYLLSSVEIYKDVSRRFDYKYYDKDLKNKIDSISASKGAQTLKQINTVTTVRGKSPAASSYVDREDGFALVVKAGSGVNKDGTLNINGDYIEKPTYDALVKRGNCVLDGDILISSTGDGTLGKCCVYRNYGEDNESLPAVVDNHVTTIRVDQDLIYPEFLCDYLRVGFGKLQINRLFTGSTGLIELTPSDVDRIVVPSFPSMDTQMSVSQNLRAEENELSKLYESITTRRDDLYSEYLKKSEK